jgi:hypothetical protein
MGIGIDVLRLLIQLRSRGYIPDGSSVMEIGAQQLSDTLLANREELDIVCRLFGAEQPCPLPPPLSPPPVEGQPRLSPKAPLARQFWTWLGLNYAAIDIDGTPDSIDLDLNYDDVPFDSMGEYHLVTNFGTTEHVANQCHAFKVIHDLTALNGIMIHRVPTQGLFMHGLVNYNPKFFWMLARSNGYKWLHMDFVVSKHVHALPPDIIDEIAVFVPDIAERTRSYRAQDCAFVVVLQKINDMPYIAPLDVNTGARTDNKRLEMRYWTVFKPEALRMPHAGDEPPSPEQET